MSQKFQDNVKKPITAWKNVRKNLGKKTPKKRVGQVAKYTGMTLAGLMQFANWLVIRGLLDNAVLRAMEKWFANREPSENNFKTFLRKHPNLSAHILYYFIVAGTIFGGKALLQKSKESEPEKDKIEIVTPDKKYENQEEAIRIWANGFKDVRRGDVDGRGHYGATRGQRMHKGVDLDYASGESIISEGNGVFVEFMSNNMIRHPGNKDWDRAQDRHWICIEQEDGTCLVWMYAGKTNLKSGDKIKKGDKIGNMCTMEEFRRWYKITPFHGHFSVMSRKRKAGELYDDWVRNAAINPVYVLTSNRQGLEKEFYYSPEYVFMSEYLFSVGQVVEMREVNNRKTFDIGAAHVKKGLEAFNVFYGKNLFDVSTKYDLSNSQEFDQCFYKAMQILFPAAANIETSEDHDDSGRRGKKNTLGMGFWRWTDKDEDKGDWYPVTGSFPAKSPPMNKKYKRMDDYFKFKNSGLAYKKLKSCFNCVMTPNEMAACLLTFLNSGPERAEVLRAFRHINASIDNKETCAMFLAGLDYGNAKYKKGLKKRHVFSALIFLNEENIVNMLPVTCEMSASDGVDYDYVHGMFAKSVYNRELSKKIARLIIYGQSGPKVFNSVMHAEDFMRQISENIGIVYVPVKTFTDDKKIQEEKKKNDSDGLAAYNRGDYETAAEFFEEYVKREPDDAGARNDLSITYYKLGRYKEAIEQARDILFRIGDRDQYSAANFNAGLAYEKMGDLESAAKNFEAAMKRSPEIGAYKKALDRVKAEMKKKKDAEAAKAGQAAVNKKKELDSGKAKVQQKTANKQPVKKPQQPQKKR